MSVIHGSASLAEKTPVFGPKKTWLQWLEVKYPVASSSTLGGGDTIRGTTAVEGLEVVSEELGEADSLAGAVERTTFALAFTFFSIRVLSLRNMTSSWER